ncbi:MAG: helix-turn-helix domain-containing protein [Actinomycetota bacterium]|nr:helix-turn-helix domain-containing protein [Actinomycetota bacterium]
MGRGAPLADSAEIGRRVKTMRAERGMKQNHLAQKAGISRGELYRIERGRVFPTMRTLRGLCTALDVSLGDLLEEGGN